MRNAQFPILKEGEKENIPLPWYKIAIPNSACLHSWIPFLPLPNSCKFVRFVAKDPCFRYFIHNGNRLWGLNRTAMGKKRWRVKKRILKIHSSLQLTIWGASEIHPKYQGGHIEAPYIGRKYISPLMNGLKGIFFIDRQAKFSIKRIAPKRSK